MYYIMGKTFKKKKHITIKKRKNKTKQRKTRNKAGMFRALKSVAVVGLLFLGSFVQCGDIYKVPVCAGNTCRSTMFQEGLKSYGKKDIFSRGVTTRNPGAPMAPLSEQMSIELCNGDQDCVDRVKSHKSTQFNCSEIVNILRTNKNAFVQLMPMDESVYKTLNQMIAECSDLTPEERTRVIIGINCDKHSCELNHADVPDPYKYQNNVTLAGPAYASTANTIRDMVSLDLQQCPPVPKEWVDDTHNNTPSLKSQRAEKYPSTKDSINKHHKSNRGK